MNVPEGAETVHVEGRDLKSAIDGAAEQLGLHPSQVDYKLDLTHFRTTTGVSVARTTVAIVAWRSDRPVSDEPARRPPPPPRPPREREHDRDRDRDDVENGAAAAPPAEGEGRERRERRDRPERGDREDRGPRPERTSERSGERGEPRNGAAGGRGRRGGRDRGDREDRPPRSERASERASDEGGERAPRGEGGSSKPDLLRGPEVGTTAASDFAQAWFGRLLSLMDVQGTVTGSGSEQRLHLAIQADRAGRIVGKRGATLGAIRHLLGLAIEKQFGQLTIDVDVGDDRPREEREAARAEREQSDRRRGGERRGGDRGPRPGGDRAGGGGADREKGRYPPEKLRALARRAAEKAESTGQTITINLELNSFDRRIVHLEVSEMTGVASQSEERVGEDGRVTKFVQIIPVKADASTK